MRWPNTLRFFLSRQLLIYFILLWTLLLLTVLFLFKFDFVFVLKDVGGLQLQNFSQVFVFLFAEHFVNIRKLCTHIRQIVSFHLQKITILLHYYRKFWLKHLEQVFEVFLWFWVAIKIFQSILSCSKNYIDKSKMSPLANVIVRSLTISLHYIAGTSLHYETNMRMFFLFNLYKSSRDDF